ncbi:phospholipase D-like domain-containing protein [uncultured Chryseobacterium sp.]|uniref:phospholipase D-like domain-containing protein n=1 Tax=uncultured Chryseobacterium sp. TaxID=259322 RepID=UPI0025FD6A7F|nr:phospholipase D-like domain-containing protein [uncultured Chryseobacterium sp.]
MNTMIQDSITDADDILLRVKSELRNARSEILIAMAWFTNQGLYDVIQEKLLQNVKVSLVLSDQPDNEKLDFDVLVSQGLQLVRIKSTGYGMMNLKFCVIDRTVAISGSYNWSNNTRNNHVQVLVTNFPKTVSELTESFFKIKTRAEKINSGLSPEEIEQEENAFTDSLLTTIPIKAEAKPLTFQEQSLKDFKDVLDNIIATEVGSFDKSLLKENAYQRAYENQGDHQVLPQAMDSLYSNFINEIEVIAEKKTRLKSRIDEQLKVSISNVEMKTHNEIESLNYTLDAEIQNTEKNIHEAEKNIEDRKQTIESNTEIRIPFIQDKIDVLIKRINELKVDFVKPPVNWPLTVTLAFIGMMLLFYIFIFYSSVAYIFIFSKNETTAALNRGTIPETPEVFNADAISQIWDKGIGGILFLFLFVGIPLGLGMMKLIRSGDESSTPDTENKQTTAGKFFDQYGGLLLIILVDCFIAYKVARNINDIEYLTNRTNKILALKDIIMTENFWLVFILGTLGVYLFSIVTEKFYRSYHKRTKTHHQEKTGFIVKNLEAEVEGHQLDINGLKEENNRLNGEIAALERSKATLTKQLQDLPVHIHTKINHLKQMLLTFKEKVENLAHIYQSQVDNDRLPISKPEMENRVNIFMEGWSKYLYEIYSVNKAELKTTEAIRECENWLNMIAFQETYTADFARN